MIPGEYILDSGLIHANQGLATITIVVVNTGDRPVQVGSHFHFFETNKQLDFDRVAAFGMRLNIPAGTAVRFEPGEEKSIELVSLGGKRNVMGFNSLTNGSIDSELVRSEAVKKMKDSYFKYKKP
jgi:urease subunit beta